MRCIGHDRRDTLLCERVLNLTDNLRRGLAGRLRELLELGGTYGRARHGLLGSLDGLNDRFGECLRTRNSNAQNADKASRAENATTRTKQRLRTFQDATPLLMACCGTVDTTKNILKHTVLPA